MPVIVDRIRWGRNGKGKGYFFQPPKGCSAKADLSISKLAMGVPRLPKVRVPVPLATQRALFIEAGYRCSVPRCTSEVALEIHHIDENPAHNDSANLLIVCANHHTLATNKKIDRKACLEIKRLLVEQKNITVDYEKIAMLIAQTLSRSGNWPDPIDPDTAMVDLSSVLDSQLGAKAEIIIRQGERLVVWSRLLADSFPEVKSFLLGQACLLSSLVGIKFIEIGFADTRDLVKSTGGKNIGNLRVRFDAQTVRRIATAKQIEPNFWSKCSALILTEENSPAMEVVELPFSELEARISWSSK